MRLCLARAWAAFSTATIELRNLQVAGFAMGSLPEASLRSSCLIIRTSIPTNEYVDCQVDWRADYAANSASARSPSVSSARPVSRSSDPRLVPVGRTIFHADEVLARGWAKFMNVNSGKTGSSVNGSIPADLQPPNRIQTTAPPACCQSPN